jgi:hypothetical protein
MTDDTNRSGQVDEVDRFAAMPIDETDGHVLDVLRGIYEVGDPVPPSLLDRVKFAITLDDFEAEVARLEREAVPELAAARAEDVLKAQTVTFTTETLSTMVTITPLSAGRVRLDGWASPGGGLDVELRVGDTIHHTIADDDGRFVFEDVSRGLAQFVLRPGAEGDAGNRVITPAIEL